MELTVKDPICWSVSSADYRQELWPTTLELKL